MKDIIFVFLISFIIALIIGMPIILKLKKMKFGQKILEEGPKWHMSKQYTPTMGGIIFIVSSCIALIAVSYKSILNAEFEYIVVLGLGLAFGLIGLLDDYTKITKKQNMGLSAKQKFLFQLAVAILFLTILRSLGFLTPNLYIPFFNTTIIMPWLLYMIISAFIIVGTVNSVNLTDGIDGLATGVTLPIMIFFVMTGLIMQNMAVSLLSASIAGGLVAFLIYNFNPAKVFMGDTGSLFLGGIVAGLAFSIDMPLILILIGFIYIIETLSDIIQVLYFKKTGGKRFFKMAPIHHHFEMSGYSEKKIVFVFSSITVFMCVLAYIGVIQRFSV